jgi:hypothetical protein
VIGLGWQATTVDPDDVGGGVDPRSHRRHDLPVDLDAALRHELLAPTPARDPGLGEHLLQTDALDRT